jgi:hypothetical protein
MGNTLPQPQMGLTFEKVWAALMETRARQAEVAELMRKDEEFFKEQSIKAAERSAELDKKIAEKAAELDKKIAERAAEAAEKAAELDKKIAERAAEAAKRAAERDKEIAERAAEAAEEWKEVREDVKNLTANVNAMCKRVDEVCKRVDKVTENVGGLNRSMGELIETLIAARLWEKFDAYSYNLKRAYQRVPLFNENNRILTDIDILLSNGDYVMAVEVKRELNRKDDVDHHLKRMKLIKTYSPAECKGKKLLGAMAGGIVDPDVRDYIHSVGFFVLELAGESVSLAETPTEFTAQEW